GVNGAAGNDDSGPGWISADGRFVVFTSTATNLISAGTASGRKNVYLRDRQAHTTELISKSSAPTNAQGNDDSGVGTPGNHVSADGRYVMFESFATNLVSGDTNNDEDIFVRDRATGTTSRVSFADGSAQSTGSSGSAAMSADGRFVSYSSNGG